MRKFYENTFGWKTEQLGPEMGDYVLVTTTETDASRRPQDAWCDQWRLLSEAERLAGPVSVRRYRRG